MKKVSFLLWLLLLLPLWSCNSAASDKKGPIHKYQPIDGFSDEVNSRLEAFLKSTIPMKIRKVAVFDCDGTLFGQVPFYLADEAMFDYARVNYQGKTDPVSREKMAIVEELLPDNNVGIEYVKKRIAFFSGLTIEQLKAIGNEMFQRKYLHKMYPEMKQLLANLKAFDFEVWIVSASPELLYQQFCAEQLGIPEERIVGVRSVVTDKGVVTDQLIFPVPQELGKAEAVNTFVKTAPLFAGGNSRGDMEMMNTSVGLKMIVNPNDTKQEPDMGGKTVRQYWLEDPRALIVTANDVREGDYTYTSEEWGMRLNLANPKKDPVIGEIAN